MAGAGLDRPAWLTGQHGAGGCSMLAPAARKGSYLVASHVTPEHDPGGVGGLERTYQAAGVPTQSRAADEFADLAFADLAVVDPGVVLVSEWRPDSPGPRPLPSEVNWYGGVGRKS